MDLESEWQSEPEPMLIAPVGFFSLMSLVFIPYEEGRLREAFGETYAAYSSRVRRWL